MHQLIKNLPTSTYLRVFFTFFLSDLFSDSILFIEEVTSNMNFGGFESPRSTYLGVFFTFFLSDLFSDSILFIEEVTSNMNFGGFKSPRLLDRSRFETFLIFYLARDFLMTSGTNSGFLFFFALVHTAVAISSGFFFAVISPS